MLASLDWKYWVAIAAAVAVVGYLWLTYGV